MQPQQSQGLAEVLIVDIFLTGFLHVKGNICITSGSDAAGQGGAWQLLNNAWMLHKVWTQSAGPMAQGSCSLGSYGCVESLPSGPVIGLV